MPADPNGPIPSLRVAVVYASLGRAAILRQVIDRLATQLRRPDLVVVSAVTPADTLGVAASPLRPEVLHGSKGSCVQRNRALEHVGDRADVIVFLDDDFVPDDRYLAEVERLFVDRRDLVGATGRMIADGIMTPGYSLVDADAFLAADVPPERPQVTPRHSLYGCNMAVRVAAIGAERFDERLPLYGWLEDVDWTHRLSRHGPLVTSERLAGVHLGVKGGRTSGVRFGYSQIANPVYMLRRGTIPGRLAWERMARNLASNVSRSLQPEPWVDRRGRLHGNLLALRDLAFGRLHPENILRMD